MSVDAIAMCCTGPWLNSVLLDLALALSLGRLVDRELDLPLAVVITFDISASTPSRCPRR
jgi:hypothetical protein